MPDWSSIATALVASGVTVAPGQAPRPVAGGDISAAWRLSTTSGELFIKTGPPAAAEMFAAEADGLDELQKARSLRVPHSVARGEYEGGAFIALEWLDLEAGNAASERLLGQRLAAMHRTTASRHGWQRDNFIGLTPQPNARSDSWIDFYAEQRLGFQLGLAAGKGFGRELADRGDALVRRLPEFFEGHTPQASLLHGDLWGGNRGCSGGEPVIFDPAVYFGDRETDIAMTRLFGGFSPEFYAAYEAAWPLADGYEQREPLYQLYHVLNHLNLFGDGYLGRAMALMDRLARI